MGKIRIKTLGDTEEEKKQKEKAEARKEAKKAKKTTKTPGLKGGERIVSMDLSEEEEKEKKEVAPQEEKKTKARPPKKHGRKYQQMLKLIDHNRRYPLSEAIVLVKKTSFTHFDGSIEVHINATEKGLSGIVQFPHSLGKEVKVAIIDEKLLKELSEGKINFDILIATPEYMPKLAKYAKTLGPRGLMPNPKAGTITTEPEKLAEKLKAGQVRYKTEPQAPLIHQIIGKVSFPQKDLEENLKALVSAVGPSKIQNLVLSASMGPSVKVDLSSFSY